MGTKLQNLASFWQEFDLLSVQKKLDSEAAAITLSQDESEASIKLLIESLRDFKKSASDDVKTTVAPIIKLFQNEVDNLKKRSRCAEKAFLDVYKQLADVPDPMPVLDQAVDRNQQLASKIQDFEIEVKQLRETMADQAREILDLKVKEKKMNELQSMVNQYDKNIDATLQERLAAEVNKVKEDFDEKFRLVEEDKRDMAKKLRDAELVAKNNQSLLDRAQSDLYEASNKLSQKSDAKSDEVEMLVNDLEEANHRATLSEKEAEQLRAKVERMANEAAAARGSGYADENPCDDESAECLRREVDAKEREIARLKGECLAAGQDLKRLEAEAASRAREAEAENLHLRTESADKQARLDSMADYDDVKRDYKILRTLEFSSSSSTTDGGWSGEEKPLEVQILERGKTLQTENTALRMEKDHLASEVSRLAKDLEDTLAENERYVRLVSELEHHVEKLQVMNGRGEAEGRASSTDILHELDVGSKSDRATPDSVVTSSAVERGGGDASSLLPIVQAQRERYRKRNEELEEQCSNQIQHVSTLQAEMKHLQADNVKLYEKIRYLQGYQSPRNVATNSDSVMVPIETRYKDQYEKKLDPFTSFSNQEKNRKYSQLSIVEKLIFFMVRFMLSNKLARLFVFAYFIFLHVLVFVVLMRMAYADSHWRDLAATEWHEKYIAHMSEQHSNGET